MKAALWRYNFLNKKPERFIVTVEYEQLWFRLKLVTEKISAKEESVRWRSSEQHKISSIVDHTISTHRPSRPTHNQHVPHITANTQSARPDHRGQHTNSTPKPSRLTHNQHAPTIEANNNTQSARPNHRGQHTISTPQPSRPTHNQHAPTITANNNTQSAQPTTTHNQHANNNTQSARPNYNGQQQHTIRTPQPSRPNKTHFKKQNSGFIYIIQYKYYQ